MAIAFRDKQDTLATPGSCGPFTVTITKPTGTVANDVLIAIINAKENSACGSPSNITGPAGWVREDFSAYVANTSSAVFSLKAGGSEPANYTFTVTKTGSPSGMNITGSISCRSGCDTTTWIDATTTVATNASSTSLTAPTITTVTANAMVLNIYAYNGTGTVTDAASTTQRVNRQAANGSVYEAEELFVSTGATGTRVATKVGAVVSRAVTIALRPSASSVNSDDWASHYQPPQMQPWQAVAY